MRRSMILAKPSTSRKKTSTDCFSKRNHTPLPARLAICRAGGCDVAGNIVPIDLGANVQTAHSLLLDHGVRTLLVTDPFGYLIGTVGLRELARYTGRLADVMTAASVSKPEAPLFSLIATLKDGKTNAVVIVDDSGCILGLVTQTDVLRAISRSLGFLELLAASQ